MHVACQMSHAAERYYQSPTKFHHLHTLVVYRHPEYILRYDLKMKLFQDFLEVRNPDSGLDFRSKEYF